MPDNPLLHPNEHSLVDLLREIKKSRKNYHEILIIEKWIAEAHIVHYIETKQQ